MSARTEAPTPRRLREARRRGDVATSRELTGAGALLGGLIGLTATAATAAHALGSALRAGIASALDGTAAAGPATLAALGLLARVAGAPLVAAMLGALLAGSVQARGLFSLEAIRPRWERVDPRRCASRLVSGERLAGVALGVVKAVALLVVAVHVVRAQAGAVPDLTRLAASRILFVVARLALGVLAPVAATLLGFALLDWALAIRRHRRGLRMTREEVRREQRDDQGDPQRKAERRRAHRGLAQAAPLRLASCLVVNPTHVAVALQHDPTRDDAPVVVAKGRGRAATSLRSAARRAGVPIVEDVALARALFRLAEIGDEIPEELYDAAAFVLAELYRGEEGRR